MRHFFSRESSESPRKAAACLFVWNSRRALSVSRSEERGWPRTLWRRRLLRRIRSCSLISLLEVSLIAGAFSTDIKSLFAEKGCCSTYELEGCVILFLEFLGCEKRERNGLCY